MQPTDIGRYKVYATIGSGGFATVYRAYDPVLDRDIAIKVLHPHLASNPDIRNRFVREGRALARVRHPDLVQVYDAGESEGHTFLAMEYVPGRSLEALAAGRPMPLSELLPITRQVAGALDAVHAAGLVHRDVKPANIRVTDEGRAVLLDLGIAYDSEGTGATTSGVIVGTPGYLAPEQVDGFAPVSGRTDVYQLGTTIFALLANQPPFRGETAQVLFAIVYGAPADLAKLRPDLPAETIAAVNWAMAKRPEDRPASAGAFAAALAGDASPASALTLPLIMQPAGPLTAEVTPVSIPAPPPPAAAQTTSITSPPTPVPAAAPAWSPPSQAENGPPVVPQAAVAATPGGGRSPVLILAAVVAVLLAVSAGWFLIGRDRGGSGARGGGAATATGRDPEENAIVPGGAPVVVTIPRPGGRRLLTFQGKAGQRISLGVTAMTTAANISLRKPDGTALGERVYVGPPESFIDTVTLPLDGTYRIGIETETDDKDKKDDKGELTLTLYDVPADVTGTLSPDGRPQNVTIVAPGQNAVLAFEGKAGQRVSFHLTRMSIGIQLTVIKPNGTNLASPTYISPKEGFLDAVSLPVVGRYEVLLDPEDEDTGTLTVALFEVPPDIAVSATLGGPAQTVTIATPGRNAVIAFEGKAGQRASIRLTRMGLGAYVSILKPDGVELLKPTYFSPPDGFIEPVTLPVAGRYEVLLDPEDANTGAMSVTLYDVPADIQAPITLNGPPVTVSLATPGQAAFLTMKGAAGQRQTLRLARMTAGVHVAVLYPDGSELQSPSYVSPREGTVEIKPLPRDGAYDILIYADKAGTTDLTAALIAAP